jgi:site-specific DNA recombinase
VWHTDRLHRSPRELEEYVDLCERRKVVTQTVKAGELDLATPSGRAVARTLGAWARFEVEHKSERTKSAQLQAAQAGKWLGGAPPLGWVVRSDGTATLDRSAAGRIRRACADVLAGGSLGSIVAGWNDAGFATGTGGRWNYTSVRQVLSRARNAGLIELNGAIVGKSTWPALVTEDVWRSVCALLADPARRRSQSNRARWLLAGIAVCGAEGCALPVRSATAVSNRAKGTTRTVYRCSAPGTGHVARSAVPLDEFVSAVIIERLSRPDALATLTHDEAQPDMEELRIEAVTLRQRLGEAADTFADGAITAAQLAKITARVQDRLGDVEATMARSTRLGALAGFAGARDPGKVWAGLPIDRRRAAVRALMTVTVLPSGKRGNQFDPDLVRIDWRTS